METTFPFKEKIIFEIVNFNMKSVLEIPVISLKKCKYYFFQYGKWNPLSDIIEPLSSHWNENDMYKMNTLDIVNNIYFWLGLKFWELGSVNRSGKMV